MFFGLAEPDSKQIHRAHHDGRTTLENMRIDHGGLHIALTQELFIGWYVGTALQQGGGKEMPNGLLREEGVDLWPTHPPRMAQPMETQIAP